ncbi:sigma-70 family RNA polymerase sigma factor [bacterium]|nr:sigma-70 family RNA polymerase sigma factor [bacterium]
MKDLTSLISRTKSGDLDAYGEIVRRFQDMAYGYSYSMLGDFTAAEDAAQESFIQAYKELANLREPDAFPGWFRKIVYTQCAMIARRNSVPTVPLDDVMELPSANTGPHELAEQSEMRQRVLNAIRALPENERVVTALFYINGYSHNDIAGFLEVPLSTVKSRLHTARTRLKKRMIDMVSESLHANKLPEDFGKRVLSSIPVLSWGNNKECTFAGALESALSITDHPCSYETIMGGTALAFRTRWWKANDGTGWCGSSPVGEFPEEIEAAGKVTGRPIRIECHLGNPEAHMERFASDIVTSIDKGIPVLGYDEKSNVSVICGYEDEGHTILMRDYFRGDQINRIEVDKLEPFLLFLTDYIGAASRGDTLKMALELAVENFSWADIVPHPNQLGSYHYGKHALAKWADDIAHYDNYTQEEREKLFFVSWWNMDCLYDARLAAESFLRQNLDLADLGKAADLYRKEVQTIHQVSVVSKEAFLGPWTGKSISDWTPEVRQREIDLLNQVCKIEEEAIGSVVAAL